MPMTAELPTLDRTSALLLACEVPTKFLPQFDKHLDYHFCLTHLVFEDEGYRKFYSASKKYKVLDNSAFEKGIPLSNKKILDAAKLIHPHEIVCRDSMGNGALTIERSQETIEYFQRRSGEPYSFMGVVQGANFKDWLKCLKWMYNNEGIDVLGINGWPASVNAFKDQLGTDDPTACRKEALRFMQKEGFTRKPTHLLGMGNNPIELKFSKRFKFVRSVDTSSPFVHGMYTVKFDADDGLYGPKIREKLNFGLAKLNAVQVAAINHNFRTIKGWMV